MVRGICLLVIMPVCLPHVWLLCWPEFKAGYLFHLLPPPPYFSNYSLFEPRPSWLGQAVGQPALGVPDLSPHSWEDRCILPCTWFCYIILGILNSVLMHMQQTFCTLSHLPRPWHIILNSGSTLILFLGSGETQWDTSTCVCVCNVMLEAAPVEGNQVHFKLFLSMHLSSANIAALWGTEN